MKKKSESYYLYLLFSKERKKALDEIPISELPFLLLSLPKRIAKECLSYLPDRKILEILKSLDYDKATDILQLLPKKRREKLSSNLDEEKRKKISFLLKFPPEKAGGIMNLNYILVDEEETFEEVSQLLKKHERKGLEPPTIIITKKGKPVGELKIYSLALNDKKEKVKMHKSKIITVKYNADIEELLKLIKHSKASKFVVLDEKDNVVGIIYIKDLIPYFFSSKDDILYAFAGLDKEESVFDSPLSKVRRRFPWLLLNLFTAFLAASVIAYFTDVLSGMVVLATFLPIVAGMGGNAATQTLAVTIRGLTQGFVDFSTGLNVIIRELITGFINGFLIGLITAIIAFFLHRNILLGFVIWIALMGNMTVAGLFGAFVPLVLKKLGFDPASSASIFITTATDMCGFFLVLYFASLLLL